jgi:hypothetical protein
MKDPLSSRRVRILPSGGLLNILVAVGLGRSALVRLGPIAARCGCPLDILGARGGRRSLPIFVPPILRAGVDVAWTLKHLSRLNPRVGKSQLTKYERRHHSPCRRSLNRVRAVMPRVGVVFAESSRPPRPAQRITRYPCISSTERRKAFTSNRRPRSAPARRRADKAGRSSTTPASPPKRRRAPATIDFLRPMRPLKRHTPTARATHQLPSRF